MKINARTARLLSEGFEKIQLEIDEKIYEVAKSGRSSCGFIKVGDSETLSLIEKEYTARGFKVYHTISIAQNTPPFLVEISW